MAKQVADVDIHAADDVYVEDLDISVDLIDDGLYLGNIACARDCKTLLKLGVTHILTIDLVPLPRTMLDRPNFTFKFIQLSDTPKDDLITKLPDAITFMKDAIQNGGTVFAHCIFGVSRSASFVIAYIMEKYKLCYEEAYTLVQSKRPYIHPNHGFVAQLKLFGHMEYRLNKDDPRFKQFRLKMAGQKLKQVKILPREWSDLVKRDPGVARAQPEPRVYRCRRCRRVLADHQNILPHLPRDVRVRIMKKGIRPPPSKLTNLTCTENGQILIQKLKNLACQVMKETNSEELETSSDSNQGTSQDEPSQEYLDGYSEDTLVDASIVPLEERACTQMWFVEPIAWMQGVQHNTQGKLNCPQCGNKIGSYNWLMGCKCPCGQKVAPAFYLVPSKVESSNIVQNVQITV